MARRRLGIQIPLYAALGVALVLFLAPVVWLVACTVKDPDDLFHYTFFPPLARFSTENFRKLVGSPYVAASEVRDWKALAARLVETGAAGASGPGRKVWDRLGPAERDLCGRVAATGTIDPAGQAALLDALNGAIARPDLLAKDDLAGLALAGDIQALAARTAAGAALAPEEAALLNRGVLEVVWPDAVVQGFRGIPFGRYMVNSLFVAGATVLIQMFFSSLGGFALAKYHFRFKAAIMVIMLGTMMIPGQVLLAPLYELIYRMGLMNSHAGLIVPAMVSVFGMFLFRQSMLQIPDELLEAGRMDGCTEFGLYWHLALPVSRPMIGAFCLAGFMGNWNAFLWPQIVLHSADLFTLPIGLNQMVGTYSQQYGIMMAGTLLAILPVMVLFLILQREFIAGLTAGAVKG
ncbi:MAG: carbohydrate ABC transporter permease [Planctomycetes bacterium]|nr:carbohydrate ABC transporter permease [Planctomycetota bacterium]